MNLVIRALPTLVFFALLLAIVLVVGLVLATVACLFRYRTRSANAVALERAIAEALLEEVSLRGVTATVRVPFWGGTPTVAVSGQVHDRELARFACHIAAAEASRLWRRVRIEDRMMISAGHAA